MPLEVTVADLVRALTKSVFGNSENGSDGKDKGNSDYVEVDMPDMKDVDSNSIEDLKDNAAQLTKVK